MYFHSQHGIQQSNGGTQDDTIFKIEHTRLGLFCTHCVSSSSSFRGHVILIAISEARQVGCSNRIKCVYEFSMNLQC